MPSRLRRLGVYGDTLPVRRTKTVTASDFLIGGLIGRFERVYDKAFLVRNMNEFMEIFGSNVDPAYYGYDAVDMFFKECAGVDASLYVKGHCGTAAGATIDAVIARATIKDQSAVDTLTIYAAYKKEREYGTHGNRIGYKITNGARFSTTLNGVATTTNTFVDLKSVAGIKVGDLMKFTHVPAGPVYVYQKITAVDEVLGRVSFTPQFGSAVFVDGDAADVMGIRVQIYEKSLTGIVKEVEVTRGKVYCTLEPEVTDYYIETVFADSTYVEMDELASVSALQLSYPSDVATVAYLLTGAYGTAPTTAAMWALHNYTAFDTYPIRMLCCPDTTLDTVNKAMETYATARWDRPKILYNLPSSQSKAQLTVIGNGQQRSSEVDAVAVAQWVKITDSFSTSPIAPYREVPNVGAVMGAWIRTIGTLGIHYIPAVKEIALKSIQGIVGTVFPDDYDRTDLAEAGINLLENLTGYGYIIRNFFTPCTDVAYMFANGILMKSYINVSAVDSLQVSENMPNSLNRILEDKMAILFFMRRLWDAGSTGSVPAGETFAISQNADGSPTKFEDHIEVKADLVNNPQTLINAGERNIDCYFTFPSPASSIKIGVGIQLLS